uniref:rho GTPase-activating protein 45 isoform X2 n=1 Tax=Ciona intestinalis TaxID=7719 RepID=UPI00089DB5EA|nr:rho GTPase-activating protein 45 isoform X2 [Ciona intestinalis]|eukprot:XP_018668445.1 rho GTPase-activating protein 45 isoform X2 [Ciona intestinalis]
MKAAFRHDDSLDSTGSGGSFNLPQNNFALVGQDAGNEIPVNSNRMDNQQNSGSGSSTDVGWTGDSKAADTRLMSQEGVFQLTKDLRTFSEALTALKSVFLDERNSSDKSQRVLAHERLGELLQVLKMVVDKYAELNSTEILSMAGVLIRHVKEYNYEDDRLDASPDIFRAINNLAMAFSNSVSECLMGDVHISPRLSMTSSHSFDTFEASDQRTESIENPPEIPTTEVPSSENTSSEHADELLQRMDAGLEMAFERAKILSKYLSDLMTYVKKKAHLEMEHSKSLLKLSQATKPILSEQSFLPFQSLYCTALDHDREYGSNSHTMYQAQILQQKFLEPLQAKKSQHDKRRKTIRDTWNKEKRRSEEAILNMKKAKQTYQVKIQEYHKAKEAAIKAETEQSQQSNPSHPAKHGAVSQTTTLGSVLYSAAASGKMEKKKRQEEDTNLKATQAEHNYKAYVMEANKRLRDLERNKVHYLQQLRDLMTQCDQTAQSVTISYFQLHQQLFSPLPVQFQAMCEDAKRYEPGFQYTEYIRNLPSQPYHIRSDFEFEQVSVDGAPYLVSGRSMETDDYHGKSTSQGHHRTKGLSDTESSSSRSLDDISPSASPGDLTRATHGSRRLSNAGSLSSEENLADKDVPGSNLAIPAEHGGLGPTPESSPVPYRHQTSKPASKIATMAANVQRAFKSKKSSKSSLFGVEFSVATQDVPDGIPYLVKRCIAEIDNRALNAKGIYRVNGVKNRVEKLCTQFDLSADRVDLSQQSPHDVSGVLKYFLRQLPEPLMQFNLYPTFLDIAKDYQQVITSTNEAMAQAKEANLPMPDPPTRAFLDSFVLRLKETVETLPLPNRNTLQYIISHLTRIASQSHDNKMTANNLAIVFGPTLLRPQLTDGNESLKTLIDMPYQSRIVELLLIHKDAIFGTHTHTAGNIFPFADCGEIIRDSSGVNNIDMKTNLNGSSQNSGLEGGKLNSMKQRPNLLNLHTSSTESEPNLLDFSPKTGLTPLTENAICNDVQIPVVPARNRSRKTSANRTEGAKPDELLSGGDAENLSNLSESLYSSMSRRISISSVSKITKNLGRRPPLLKSGSFDSLACPLEPKVSDQQPRSRKLPTIPAHVSGTNSAYYMAGRTPPQPSMGQKSSSFSLSLPNPDTSAPAAKRGILLDDFKSNEEKEGSFC